jgi:hypothetical protein
MKNRGCLVVSILVAAVASACALTAALNSARRPRAVIEAELLAATPIGSDIDTVQRYVERRWGRKHHVYEIPFDRPFKGKRIGQEYGSFIPLPEPWPEVVMADWYFDENGRLRAIRVWGYSDCP